MLQARSILALNLYPRECPYCAPFISSVQYSVKYCEGTVPSLYLVYFFGYMMLFD